MNDSEYDIRAIGATIPEEGHNRITIVKLWNSHETVITQNKFKGRYYGTTLICQIVPRPLGKKITGRVIRQKKRHIYIYIYQIKVNKAIINVFISKLS